MEGIFSVQEARGLLRVQKQHHFETVRYAHECKTSNRRRDTKQGTSTQARTYAYAQAHSSIAYKEEIIPLKSKSE